MSFSHYLQPTVDSFMERDSTRVAAQIARDLSRSNPFVTMLHNEVESAKIAKRLKRWRAKLNKARRKVGKLETKLRKLNGGFTVITTITERGLAEIQRNR